MTRTASNAFIGVFLAAQILIPLRYYFGADVFDERFSWRMFSSVRVTQCSTELLETRDDGESTVQLNRIIHEAWIANLKRNRSTVVRALLERRCEESGVRSARVVNKCTSATNEALPEREWTRVCATGEEKER